MWKFKVVVREKEYIIHDNDFIRAAYRVIKYLDKTPDIKMNTPLNITIEKLERIKND